MGDHPLALGDARRGGRRRRRRRRPRAARRGRRRPPRPARRRPCPGRGSGAEGAHGRKHDRSAGVVSGRGRRVGRMGTWPRTPQRWRDPHPQRVPVAPPSVVGCRPGPQGRAAGSPAGRKATGRGLRSLGRGTAGPAGSPWSRPGAPRRPRAPASPGCHRLIQMHVFNTAGDAAVAISLAGSLFFQVPVGRGARPGRAVPRPDDAAVRDRGAADRPVPRPVRARPALGDRRDDGGRGRSCAGRSPRRSSSGSALVFAAALGVLVSSKAYGVTRAAAVPRLLPRDFTLVKANGRVSLAGIVGASRLGADRRAGLAGRARSGRCATPSCCS